MDSKTKITMIITPIIVVLLVLCIVLLALDNKKETIEKEQKPTYDPPVEKLYLTDGFQKVYLYNLQDLRITSDNTGISLYEYVRKYEGSIDKAFASLVSKLELVTGLNDGGTNIYKVKDKRDFDNLDLIIIKCNTLDNNKDYYFGIDYDTTDAFKNHACGKYFFSDVNFERVYKVINIKKENKDNLASIELTLKDTFKESHTYNKTATIKMDIKKELADKLVKNKSYSFMFYNKYGYLIKEDIGEIFKNSTLVDIKEYN